MGIVCDGAGRWRAGMTESIRANVTAAYAERYQQARRWKRLGLRLEIEREVSRRLKGVMSPSRRSLY